MDAAEEATVRYFESRPADARVGSRDLAAELEIEHATFVDSVLKRLTARDVLAAEAVSHQTVSLTGEGEQYRKDGSPEFQYFRAVQRAAEPPSVQVLGEQLSDAIAKVGMQNAMKKKWIVLDKASKTLSCAAQVVEDEVANVLATLALDDAATQLPEEQLKELKQRKLVVVKMAKTFDITRGPRFDDARKVQAAELTSEMLQSGAWEHAAFKAYNFAAEGRAPEYGCLHPLLKVREQFRMIFVQLGFEEMPTDNYVESSFWNFDALFQPQQHPARDAHDTFFLSSPATARVEEEAYLERVREVHQSGGYGSLGYQYKWSKEEACKNILRTHTTAVSSRMLYDLARQTERDGHFTPRKYFSIDRVFRNETLDATHLAEFHQIEGLVAAPNLSLADLKGVIGEFFKRMGMTKLRFKPAHNPYTEPSMEIFSYHDGLQKWVEVGNSGIFRPEMLRPMGLPADVRVIAWGLSLERPTMIMYGIKNIRDLFGHKVDIAAIRVNPVCRMGIDT
ncbi:Phenylalanine--tRNA ligase alpha subunit, cytoplasmic [Porphyridium purpureum]|uniref:phenylalanine--tRNA ligase n=1 Tax=Porphyridium purpureum TaxID=35688 RepID=A0A5J4YT81_PORPP|nr:Phenylalanine--tRNA ligase alpha subunit, cytoplasmic [Porphyridium purpureum]|eukprot:POR8013..scf229_5